MIEAGKAPQIGTSGRASGARQRNLYLFSGPVSLILWKRLWLVSLLLPHLATFCAWRSSFSSGHCHVDNCRRRRPDAEEHCRRAILLPSALAFGIYQRGVPSPRTRGWCGSFPNPSSPHPPSVSSRLYLSKEGKKKRIGDGEGKGRAEDSRAQKKKKGPKRGESKKNPMQQRGGGKKGGKKSGKKGGKKRVTGGDRTAELAARLRAAKEGRNLNVTLDDDERPPAGRRGDSSFLTSLKDTLQTIADPYEAGYQFRRTLGSALTTFAGVAPESRSNVYYLDDRLFALEGNLRNYSAYDVPEILVVGATTKIGQLIVRKLLLRGMRVRVLVPNLYSSTLNLFGTNVIYCQGDLNNVESLEYALTDVDKIVFCADDQAVGGGNEGDKNHAARHHHPEQLDVIGMGNLLHAYQNVRFVDYGAGQAAKRSLFKFQDRPEDFGLFDIDQEKENEEGGGNKRNVTNGSPDDSSPSLDQGRQKQRRKNVQWCRWMKNKFDHGVFLGQVAGSKSPGGGGEASIVSTRLRARRKKDETQQDYGVGAEEDSDEGIDLSRGFAGFVCRLCGDGGVYEAFVRTGAYEKYGVEYVKEFQTVTKPPRLAAEEDGGGRAPRRARPWPKFLSVRMPFSEFKPRRQSSGDAMKDSAQDSSSLSAVSVDDEGEVRLEDIPQFDGKDVRRIGFRFRSENNEGDSVRVPNALASQARQKIRFYLALSYIKLFRANVEPEFVYLSDANIPPVVENGMVRHDMKKIVPDMPLDTGGMGVPEALPLFENEDSSALESHNGAEDPQRLSYFKYRGEQLLRNSGLSYAIVRVSDFNDAPGSDISTLKLQQTNDDVKSVSRIDAAEVCVSCLLDPTACNLSFYLSKTNGGGSAPSGSEEEEMTEKFARLQSNL